MTTLEEDFTTQHEDNDEAIAAAKLKDAEEAPGYPIEFDPHEAKQAGMFVDAVVSDEEALAAALDII